MSKNTRTGMERIFRMAAMLQNQTKDGQKITCRDLQDEFEIDRSTVMRDLNFIRDRLEMDVEWDQKAQTYVVESNSEFLPAMELEDKDYLVMSFFQQCLAPFASTEMGKQMLASFERMFGLLAGSNNWNQWANNVLFRFADRPPAVEGRTSELKIFNLLHRAIRDRKVVEFTYKSPSKSTATQKKVEPHLITMTHGRWHLQATDAGTRHLTSFAFPRIRDLKITGEKFNTEPAKHPRELLQHSFGSVMSTDEPRDIVLEFEPRVVERVLESVWHPRQRTKKLPGGRLQLVLPLNSTLEIAPWILSWGPYATVVEPADLRDSVADSIRRMAENYSKE